MGLRSRLTLLAVFAGALVFVADTSGVEAPAASAASSTTTTTANPNAPIVVKAGGTATVAVSNLPSEFNPATPRGDNAITDMVMQQVWPQAFVINGNSQATAVLDARGAPGLFGPTGAELVSVNPETVVYSINPKARWSDGVPISAADFIYNWREQLIVGPSLPATDPLLGYEDIKSITGTNNGKTVTVVFAKSYADWESLFSDLVPAHIGERYGWETAFSRFDPTKVISGGPFAITRVVPGRELVLSRNKSYWGAPPVLQHIIFRVAANTEAVLDGLNSGRIDVAQVPPGPEVEQLLATNPNLVSQPSLSSMLWQLAFNLANPGVSSVNVRQGIADAIDRDQLVSNTVGFLTPFNQIPGNRLYPSGAPGSQGNASAYGQVQVAEADAQFVLAGDTLASSGRLLDPSGVPVSLDLVAPTGVPIINEVEAELQAQLLQAGITLHIHNVPLPELLDSILPKGSYELALAPFLESGYPSTSTELYSDPIGPTPNALSFVPARVPQVQAPFNVHIGGSEIEPGALDVRSVTRNVLGFDDPAVSALFAQAASQLNASSESDLYNRIDTDLWQDMPTLPLFQMPTILITRWNLDNVSDTQTPVGELWDAQDWAIQVSPVPTTTTVP